MKPWIKNSVLLAASIVLALLICEGIVRILKLGGTAVTRGMLHQFDPEAGWKCIPNLDARFSLPGSFDVRIQCNSQGLRDSNKSYTKPPGTRRIIILGDSFMWGYGVENSEMFSAILQDLLPDTETINFGVNGYSTVQELVRLEIEGLRYDPDVIVLVFVWNDLEDNFDDKNGGRPVAVIQNDNTLRIANRPVRRPWKSPIQQWFRHHSHLFRFVEYNLELLKHKSKNRKRAGHRLPGIPVSGVAIASEGEQSENRLRFSITDIYARPNREIDLAWNAMHQLLLRIKQLASLNGGRLVVVHAAVLEAVNPRVFKRALREAGHDPKSTAFNWNRPSRRLKKLCKALDIRYVNLTPVFRRHLKRGPLFLKNNPHWSAAGHRLAAKTVAKRIKDFIE